ncbi:MAG: hypothetical protein ACK5M3_00840 [Dysgonomonas sp.]
MMKNILPIENITYKSSLSHNEVYNRLVSIIRTDKTYIGGWTNNTFKIKRNINYRNSFLPQIKGEICREKNETLIIVKMTLPPAILVFVLFWLIFASFACVLSINTMIMDGFEVFYLVPFGMLLFGYILVFTAFKYESLRSKMDLLKIFEADVLK